MECEVGSLVMTPLGNTGMVIRHMGERVTIRYKDGEEVTLKPQLLIVLTPYREVVK